MTDAQELVENRILLGNGLSGPFFWKTTEPDFFQNQWERAREAILEQLKELDGIVLRDHLVDASPLSPNQVKVRARLQVDLPPRKHPLFVESTRKHSDPKSGITVDVERSPP